MCWRGYAVHGMVMGFGGADCVGVVIRRRSWRRVLAAQIVLALLFGADHGGGFRRRRLCRRCYSAHGMVMDFGGVDCVGAVIRRMAWMPYYSRIDGVISPPVRQRIRHWRISCGAHPLERRAHIIISGDAAHIHLAQLRRMSAQCRRILTAAHTHYTHYTYLPTYSRISRITDLRGTKIAQHIHKL